MSPSFCTVSVAERSKRHIPGHCGEDGSVKMKFTQFFPKIAVLPPLGEFPRFG
jgi:hypothetical protein